MLQDSHQTLSATILVSSCGLLQQVKLLFRLDEQHPSECKRVHFEFRSAGEHKVRLGSRDQVKMVAANEMIISAQGNPAVVMLRSAYSVMSRFHPPSRLASFLRNASYITSNMLIRVLAKVISILSSASSVQVEGIVRAGGRWCMICK